MSRISLLVFLLVLAVSGYGQSSSINCPKIVVLGPAGITVQGESMTFSVELSGPQIIGNPDYKWSVSRGSIAGGQGTRSIIVDTGGAGDGVNVTATVTVQGVLPGCTNTAYETAPIEASIACGLPADDYEKVPWNVEKARLDNVMIQLNNNPGTRLFIYLRITADESFDETHKHAGKMIRHLLSRNKEFDAGRVMFVMSVDDNGHSTIFDLVPEGVKSSRCETGCIQISGSELVRK